MIQTNLVCSYDDKGRVYQNCKFMTPGAWVLMLGRGHISHYSEYVVSSTLSIYSILVAIVLRDSNASFLYHRWFSFTVFYDGLLIYKYEPLWQEVSLKSLILRWPLMPVGLLLEKGLVPWIPFIHECVMPSFVKIGLVVLEKKNIWKVYRQADGRPDRRTDDGR